jgi:hypothetical protein
LVNLFREPLFRCFSYETPDSLPTDEAQTLSNSIKSSESTVSSKKIYSVYMRIIYIKCKLVVGTVLTAFTITAVRMPLVDVRSQSLSKRGEYHVPTCNI